MRNRIFAVLTAVGLLLGLGVGVTAQSAQAADGHITVACGEGTKSTGWQKLYHNGNHIATACLVYQRHGYHVDVTYWAQDNRADGIDINIYRDLSWVAGPYVQIASCSGSGTVVHDNKQYSDDPDDPNQWISQMTGDQSLGIYRLDKLTF